MSRRAGFVSLLAAAAFFSAPALAVAAQSDTQPQQNTGTNTTANHDFGKFSKEGAKAMNDIDMARLDIFDGQTANASRDLQMAKTALEKAKSDGAVFERAEADLHPPKSGNTANTDQTANNAQTGNNNRTAGNDQTANNPDATTPIKWVPVGGSLVLDEDYLAKPENHQAVAEADAKLKNGDTKGAMDTLKLHDVEVAFDMNVAPLQKTIAGVDKADTLVNQGQYYEASQVLRGVQNSVRVDEEIYAATPQKKQPNKASG